MTALGYIRRSKESSERTVSLDAQRVAIERYCAERGWRLAATVIDDGVSGGRRERLTRIDAKVRETQARVVVVYHLDRFARDVAALLDSMRVYDRRGVELHVVGRGRVETQTASGYLGVAIEGVLAEHYRKLVSEKTRDALARLRATGRRVSGHAPFGYRVADDGRHLLPDATEQAALALIRRLAPGHSLRALSAELAKRGVTARCGRAFSAKVLRDLVTIRTVGNSATAG